MIDLKYIKENPEEVIERYLIKGKDAKEDIEKILALDTERRSLIGLKIDAVDAGDKTDGITYGRGVHIVLNELVSEYYIKRLQ